MGLGRFSLRPDVMRISGDYRQDKQSHKQEGDEEAALLQQLVEGMADRELSNLVAFLMFAPLQLQ